MRGHPAEVGNPQGPRFLVGRDAGLIEEQIDRVPNILMGSAGLPAADPCVDSHALANLSCEGCLIGFARLDLATRKLPQPPELAGGTPLGDEVAPLLLDDGNHHSKVSERIRQSVLR
jgi:hypothetical protein